jgi:hypothetical protein
MQEIIKEYVPTLIKTARGKLEREFSLSKFNFKDFEYVNSYLIFQAIEKEINVLITIPDRSNRFDFYIPTIFILAIESFFKNYIDNITKYKIGDIVECKKGKRYKITDIRNDGFYELTSDDKYKTKLYTKNIEDYTITTAYLSKIKTASFRLYKHFFNSIFKVGDKLPSRFKYKSIIVASKEIIDTLKDFKINSTKIYKAFPFQYLTKSGNKQDNIPIDPMIYIVNDYDTAKRFLLDYPAIEIENLIIIGSSRYRDYASSISSDLRNNKFKNCILIGTEDVEGFPDLFKWKWTLPEFNCLNHIEVKPISKIVIEDTIFSNLIKDFDQIVREIEHDYSIDLRELYSFVRKLFSIIIPNEFSRLNNQIDAIKHCFEKEAYAAIMNKFHEIGEYDYEDIWKRIEQKYTQILDRVKINYLKFEKLKEIKNIDYLVVPFEYKETWAEETHRAGLIRTRVISHKEYENLNESVCRQVIFLSFYGYKHLEAILNTCYQIYILMYKEEKDLFEKCYMRYKSDLLDEIKSESRNRISAVKYEEKTKIEQISELIERLCSQDLDTKCPIKPDAPVTEIENIMYELIFEDGTAEKLDANKTVLLIKEGAERNEKIYNLVSGDEVRIYNNSTKEQLYEIALQEDKEDRIKQIEEHSKIWKKKLVDYSKRNFNTTESFFNALKDRGISIKNILTLKKWLNLNDNVKFPQSTKDFTLLKHIINDEALNNNFPAILKSRRFYNSIMIALGRDLSDEITSYIRTGQKGQILKRFSDFQINKFVQANAPKRKVKSIKILDEYDA